MTPEFLRSLGLALELGKPTAFKVNVHRGGQLLPSYHLYRGSKYFVPSLPDRYVLPGEMVTISIEPLSAKTFIAGLPSFSERNSSLTRWVSGTVIMRDFSLDGKSIQVRLCQDNAFVDGVENFALSGRVVRFPGTSNQHGGVYLQFGISDYAGRTTCMRILHDGFNLPRLQIDRGAGFEKVSLISYDGYRLSIVYGGTSAISTIYLHPPSDAIYSLGTPHTYVGEFLDYVKGMYSKAFMVDEVSLRRSLEQRMLEQGYTTDLGRLGAELAYVVGTKDFGLKDPIIQEPTQCGRDLYTKDGAIAIQARFLKNIAPWKFEETIQRELLNLLGQLNWDYYHNTRMRSGYAVLTFVETNGSLRIVALEVQRANRGRK